jgi:hypothetical protein
VLDSLDDPVVSLDDADDNDDSDYVEEAVHWFSPSYASTLSDSIRPAYWT